MTFFKSSSQLVNVSDYQFSNYMKHENSSIIIPLHVSPPFILVDILNDLKMSRHAANFATSFSRVYFPYMIPIHTQGKLFESQISLRLREQNVFFHSIKIVFTNKVFFLVMISLPIYSSRSAVSSLIWQLLNTIIKLFMPFTAAFTKNNHKYMFLLFFNLACFRF